MSFDQIERSPDRGQPIELYMFRWGKGKDAFLAITNHTRPVPRRELDLSGNEVDVVYRPEPIARESYKVSGKVERSKMDIRVALDSELSRLFVEYPPSAIVTLIVRQMHLSDEDFEAPVVWNGRVLNFGRRGHETVLSCDNTTISLKRVGLRRKYQYGCPLVLYGSGCRASKENATFTATVETLSSSSLGLAPGWNGSQPLKDFSGGILEWDSDDYGLEIRSLRSVSENGDLNFIGSLRGLKIGEQVRIILGCNHQMDHCRRLHDNILNYGGHPWIPTKNPVKYHNFW